MILTTEQINNYNKDGAIVIKNIFKPWIDILRKGFEEVLNHLDKSESETSNWFCSLKNISLKELISIEVFTDKWDWANDDNIQYAVRKAEALK